MAKKILIIEDNFQTLDILKTKLKREGYEIIIATLGLEGIAAAQATLPHLIIADILLSGDYNGLEVLEEVKKDKKLKNIPVILLTNLDTEEAAAKKLGAYDYLVKANTSISEVVKRVNSCLL